MVFSPKQLFLCLHFLSLFSTIEATDLTKDYENSAIKSLLESENFVEISPSSLSDAASSSLTSCQPKTSIKTMTLIFSIQQSTIKSFLMENSYLKNLTKDIQNCLQTLKYGGTDLSKTNTIAEIYSDQNFEIGYLQYKSFRIYDENNQERVVVIIQGSLLTNTISKNCIYSHTFREKFVGKSQPLQNIFQSKVFQDYSSVVQNSNNFNNLRNEGFNKVSIGGNNVVYENIKVVNVGEEKPKPDVLWILVAVIIVFITIALILKGGFSFLFGGGQVPSTPSTKKNDGRKNDEIPVQQTVSPPIFAPPNSGLTLVVQYPSKKKVKINVNFTRLEKHSSLLRRAWPSPNSQQTLIVARDGLKEIMRQLVGMPAHLDIEENLEILMECTKGADDLLKQIFFGLLLECQRGVSFTQKHSQKFSSSNLNYYTPTTHLFIEEIINEIDDPPLPTQCPVKYSSRCLSRTYYQDQKWGEWINYLQQTGGIFVTEVSQTNKRNYSSLVDFHLHLLEVSVGTTSKTIPIIIEIPRTGNYYSQKRQQTE